MEKTKINITDEVVIHISDMNKWFGNFHVLRDINLEVRKGERIVVCGPSGSGKSTLIRCVNALESHNSGDIELFGVSIQDYQTNNLLVVFLEELEIQFKLMLKEKRPIVS